MARARSHFHNDKTNQEISQHLRDAERALARAMDMCIRVSKSRDGVRSMTAKHVRRDIGRALDSIRSIRPIRDTGVSDIDLISEDQRAEMSRQKKADRKESSI